MLVYPSVILCWESNKATPCPKIKEEDLQNPCDLENQTDRKKHGYLPGHDLFCLKCKYMGVSKNRGCFHLKWMVKIMVPNPMNKWDDLGEFYTPIWLVVSTHLKNMLVKLDHFPK